MPMNISTDKQIIYSDNGTLSDQISRSVMSNSLRPHESQHTRPPYPSPTPGVHRDSRPSSQWCHPAISSSVVPFSSCPQSLPAAESFPMCQLFAWGGQYSKAKEPSATIPNNRAESQKQCWAKEVTHQRICMILYRIIHIKFSDR